MIRRPPRSTQSRSSAASDVYKRQPLKLREGTKIRALKWPLKEHSFAAIVNSLSLLLPGMFICCSECELVITDPNYLCRDPALLSREGGSQVVDSGHPVSY